MKKKGGGSANGRMNCLKISWEPSAVDIFSGPALRVMLTDGTQVCHADLRRFVWCRQWSEEKRLAWEKEFYWLHVLEPLREPRALPDVLMEGGYDDEKARPGKGGRQMERVVRKVGALTQEMAHFEWRLLHSLGHLQGRIEQLPNGQAGGGSAGGGPA